MIKCKYHYEKARFIYKKDKNNDDNVISAWRGCELKTNIKFKTKRK